MTVRIHSVPRRAAAPDEYEDAAYPAESGEFDGDTVRVAVADGATTSSFSGEWARLLSGAWGAGELAGDGAWLPALVCRWREAVDRHALSWFAADKLRAGSHAALLGVELHADGRWSALSVGDCCLFLVRDDTLIEAFPARRPEALQGRPALVGTGMSVEEFRRNVQRADGWWQAGDTLFLMSDALGRWFLDAALVKRSSPWRILASVSARPESFTAFVERLRESGALQPDDVTLASVLL